MMDKWDRRFMEMARIVSTWSKDPSTKVGAVLVRPNKSIASVGYNGLPAGMPDEGIYLDDRETKYQIILHAEDNCITHCRDVDLTGYTLYTYPLMPCARCMSTRIAANGIGRIVSVESTNERWDDSFSLSKDVAHKCGVHVELLPEF